MSAESVERTLVIIREGGKTELLVSDTAYTLQGDRQVEPMLEELASSDNPVTRAKVARVIPSFASDRTLELLDTLTDDEDPDVRLQASQSASAISEERI